MSTIVEYAVRSDGLALSAALGATDVRLVVERTVGTDPSCPVLFAWVGGGDLAAFDAALAADETVADWELLSEADNRRLYRFQVAEDTDVVLYPRIVALGASRLEAKHEDDWWYARTRFPDAAAFDEYAAFLEEHDIELRVLRRYDADGTDRELDGLTTPQREALVLAYRRGYFSIPREVTTAELADELGVSNQAVSERLRRGYARLVERGVGV